MKKILMATLCFTIAAISFAQKTTTAKGKKTTTTVTATEPKEKKPSKQETMDWIGGKMKEYLIAPREFVSYNNGVVVYKLASSVKKELGPGTLSVIYVNTLDLNKVTGMSQEYSSDF